MRLPAAEGTRLSTFAAELSEPQIGYDPSGFARLASLEGSHFRFTARTRLILWALRLQFPDEGSLLEIGCGTGNVLASMADRLPRWRLVGSDPRMPRDSRSRRGAPPPRTGCSSPRCSRPAARAAVSC
jgi:hypothetical protein